VIQHPDDSAPNKLPEILSSLSGIRAEEAADGTALAADRIYVGPARSIVRLHEGILEVAKSITPADLRGPIDAFFHSLAEDRQAGAIGVILSGSGTDGALGLKAINDAGGMTIAQEPQSARYDSMPRSGATLGVADRVLAPEKMAGEIVAYAKHAQTLIAGDDGGAVHEQIGGALGTICELLERHTEHDFKHYKTSTLVRRISRRMKVLRIASAADYVARLEVDAAEIQALFRELLIGVTCFFRDPAAFEVLRQQVISRIFENRGQQDPVRIWVPGCATGEEAYTLAMLLREEMDRHGAPPEVQIFATDINEKALTTARQGLYPASIAEEMTAERLQRFFINQGKRFAAAKEIREMCLFSIHDLIRDPPFSRLDLISCRNLLIYLGAHLQKKLIPAFHYALRPGGYLFLGPSESSVAHQELFKPVDVKHRIAQRLPTTVRSPAVPPRQDPQRASLRASGGPTAATQSDIHLVMQRIVLDEFAPKSVVINGEAQIVCASGGMERFLGIGEGRFKNNVIKLARSGLRVGIRTSLSEAIESRRTVKNDNLAIQTEKGVNRVRLTVQPMPHLGEESGLYLLVFEDLGPLVDRDEHCSGRSDDDAHALIEHLEHELQTTRDDLERTIQEIEAANQELKSSNEELLSMNEELQSANEELETSREETQAGNDALVRANTDLENLLASTQVATIFLDEQLNIQRFTPAVADIYNLIPGDIGRPLFHITHRVISMPPLPGGGSQVAGSLEQEIETEDGKWYIRRVLPYRNFEGRPQGLVVTFVDVTDLKRAQASLHDREERLALALEAGGMGTWEWDVKTDAVRWSDRMFSLLDLEQGEKIASASTFFDRIHPDDIGPLRESLRQAIEADGDYNAEFRVVLRDRSIRWLAGRGRVMRDAVRGSPRMRGVNFDITNRKRDEESLQQSESQFRALAESIPQLAWMGEPGGHIFWYNKRWYEYTGTTLDSMKESGWQSVHDPEVLPRVLEQWTASLEQSTSFEMVFPIKGRDGRSRAFLTRILPVKDERGAVVRWFGTSTDIEAQKQAEEDLKRANRHKDEFLAMLAHELRNPLSPIRNAVRLLKFASPNDPTMAGARDMIDRQVTHLVRLVDDLLDVSRITRGKIDLRQDHVNLSSVMEAATESARPLIDSRRHHLEVTLPTEPLTVVADPTRLSQVVLNLLNNSAKYTQEGGRISLSVERQNELAIIRVRDNGMGIAPELLPSIFELFTQAERTIDRSQGGLGIGLTIVRRLVEMQGGSVEAHSEGPGRGSEFIVKIPVAPALRPEPPLPAQSEPPVQRLRSARVLVVDDHADSADSLSLILKHLGHRVETAYDSRTALNIARQFRPKILFCDLGLPVMDGFEVARQLRLMPETRDTVLVALTGYGQDEDKKKTLSAGFHYHLVKPVSAESLQDVLKQTLQDSETSQSMFE
jgi:two-component system CheB/CheR fusion protein